MKKKLTEMSLEELWQLFPIFLIPYKKEWKEYFEVEKENIISLLKNSKIKRLEHIGSTTIPNIYSKDIIDILLEVDDDNFETSIEILKSNGYILMNIDDKRADFNKGYTEDGFDEKVYHLHLRMKNDIEELYFRDYLIENTDIAKDYEELKLALAPKYKHNRDKYTQEKSEFIKNITKKAKEFYKNKYE
jgi:GrpB-like predicted nucleotidyltransferase (UPF0157 family)